MDKLTLNYKNLYNHLMFLQIKNVHIIYLGKYQKNETKNTH